MNCDVSKESFLANSSNKEKFIRLVGEKLSNSNCNVSYEDADIYIEKVCVDESLTINTHTKKLYYSASDTKYSLFLEVISRRAKRKI